MKHGSDDYFDGPGQLLIKVAPSVTRGRGLSLDGSDLKVRPLCPNETSGNTLGMSSNPRWHVAELGQAGMTNRDLWEAAHRAAETPAFAGAAIEPDLVQRWDYTNPITTSAGLGAAPGDLCEFTEQDDAFPLGPSFAWHLGDTYSQLKSARDQLATNTNRVRIGILDTGLDPRHVTLPKNTLLNLARNFVNDGQAGNDVSDPYERGLLNNPGHGTGTLSLLAGNLFANAFGGGVFNDYIGGAPNAEILPIRIATSVILFRTSAFAEGLDYLIAPNGNAGDRVDVVSMSMGGLASQAWADVVNRAYEAGITIVTAAGNNIFVSPKEIVYPARFNRVIAACGVMANGQPYTREFVPLLKMAGNCGPKRKMNTALSAYTPNTSWAEINCKNLVDMDGAGTSSATPQIAAAAALWLQKNKAALAGLLPWQVVEAVRWALFSSAKQPPAKYVDSIGRGILQAAAALKVKVNTKLNVTPADNVDFALLKVLFGGPGIAAGGSQLLQLELAQTIQRNAALSKKYAEITDSGNPIGADDQRW
ncbi:MAG: S8/S53 family peptidase, partial [Usitatibacteraceae bacterium]